MPPPKPYQEEPEDESWLTTYADAITLLMAFFVMLLSMAKIDVAQFEQAAEGIKSNLRGKQTQGPISLMKMEVQDVIYEIQADEAVNVQTTDRGLSIEMASSAFFKSGASDLRDEAIPVVEKIFETLNAPRYQFYKIDVEGHTDDIPIQTTRFPSNWELSAGRAATVVRFFLEKGMAPDRIKVSAFADTKPKAVNRDSAGNPIPANQALNRRVSLEIIPMSQEERKMAQMKLAAAAKETPKASATLPGGAAPQSEPGSPSAPAASPAPAN